MFYFIPFWFFAGESRVLGTLIIPIGRLVFLVFAPRLGRMGTRRALLIALAFLGVAGVTWLLGQMAVMGYQVPMQGCAACHRSTIVGGASAQVSEFEIRDPGWLVFHLRDPQGSLLIPFSTPQD